MEVIIHWLKVIPGAIDNPVCQCRPADLGTILSPVFLLTVKRKSIGVLLIHRPCNGGCGRWAFSYQGPRNLRLYDHRFFCVSQSFLTGRTSITLAVVFDHFTCGRNEFQLTANILFADQNHLRTTDRADLIFFQKRDDYFFNLQAFKKILMGCFLLAGMLPDHGLFFQQGKILFHFRFIKKVLLSWNVIGPSFAGGTEKLFGKIVHLFLKGFFVAGFFINNKTERSDQFRLLRDHCFQLCYGVLQL